MDEFSTELVSFLMFMVGVLCAMMIYMVSDIYRYLLAWHNFLKTGEETNENFNIKKP